MSFVFRASDIKKLGKLFDTIPKTKGSNYRFEIAGRTAERRIALEIYPGIRIGNRRGNLISVYTQNTHLQLHFCSGYVVSEMLGEVTFVGEYDGRLSGLIIEKEGGCSLYANVDRALLSGDFTRLGPEVMLSGIALSLTDTILANPARTTRRRQAERRRKSP
jgi:hypothetical protein